MMGRTLGIYGWGLTIGNFTYVDLLHLLQSINAILGIMVGQSMGVIRKQSSV